ncbi:cytochrome P450 2C31 [Hypoxylon crocopeplum]|nr:cytochrome P450 2C31 [Hypoxylon crocopeplum]
MELSYDILTCLILTLLICLYTSWSPAQSILQPPPQGWLFSDRRYVMPPGPQGHLIVGSLLPWLRARSNGTVVPWLMEQACYGELTTLKMGSKIWVLLNSGRVVNEIMAKQASITHERPHFPIGSDLVSRNKRILLKKTASLGLLRAYLDEPKAWYAHNYRYAAAIMHKIVSNVTLDKSREELQELQRVHSTFLKSINSSIIDFFPRLAQLPRWLQFWRTHWEEMGMFHYDIYKHWWAGMAPSRDSNAVPSFVRDVVLKEYWGTEEEAMYLTMSVISAGVDNPPTVTNVWIMACLAYPATVQRAHDELERVCGVKANRLPSLDDLPRLPYMFAVVKECLRWKPTVPLVPQRVLVEDLEFEGYRFPAGTEFLVNSVPVCRNGYDQPTEFLPERWLEDRNQDFWQFAFSAGRRSCVGYKVAQKMLFVAFARLLYCFDFSPASELDDTKVNVSGPGEPFPLKVTARSPEHERLIRDEAVKCDDIWGS